MTRVLRTLPRCAVALAALLAVCTDADSADRHGKPVDFSRDIYPILKRACFECHGAEKQEASFRLDERTALLDSGMIEPGDPASSELLRRVRLPREDLEIMPAVGDPLPRRDIRLLERWIEQGADWPTDFQPPPHWAYVAPQRPAPPAVQNEAWPRTPIDHFVLHRLEQEGLTPSPRARPETLIRRLYLDLIGLPPTPEEVTRFVVDPSEAAYARIVDELLARPQFGERWARPWLDLARYADSHGFQRDNLRDIWAYRDWVIQALNDDMPFDQFTIEQIAGDLLPGATEAQKIATGFHRCVPTNVEAGSLPEETRIEQVIDRVNTTGAVWLGTTLECAQCHDHKYDPFSMKDYFRLLAFFNHTEREADRANPKVPSSIKFQGPSMPLADVERDAQRAEAEKERAGIKQQLAKRKAELEGTLAAWADDFRVQIADAPQTHPLQPVAFASEGTTDEPEIREDGTILLRGDDPPNTDLYSVTVSADLEGIRAFRLDALTDEALPGSGPGRGDPKKTNFVLNEFRVIARHPGQEPVTLAFSGARADFSQARWDVPGAVDGDPKTGWAIAPEFGKPHWAVFLLKEPFEATPETEVTIELEQRYGSARTIGCFRLSAITGNVDADSLPGDVTKALAKSAEEWTDKERETLLAFRVAEDSHSQELQQQVDRLTKQINKLAPDTTLVMIELEQPRDSYMFVRGDYRQRGEDVTPGTPDVLHPLPEGPANRLSLARWLVDPANPLVARVTVNRWWGELFGAGIVRTPEDFGIKGEPPTHPGLLDWLAVEFVENGWSLKRLLKTIVLSATYQQSSTVTPELAAQDDQNLLLARGPRFRMDAEMIRDNALAIGGLLDLKQYGPPIRPYQPEGIWRKVGGTNYEYVVSPGSEQYRRGVYVVLKRGAPYPSFVNFDASARLACTVERSRTNTPLQALTLLNDRVYVDAARGLAHRVLNEVTTATRDEQLAYAFQLCTARTPRPEELQTLRELFDDLVSWRQREPKETKAFLGDAPQIDGVTPAELAAWYSVGSVLLNLHETITKN